MSDSEKTEGPGWSLTVEPGGGLQRLDRFLAARITRLSRARASRLQALDVDRGRWLKKSQLLREGQRLWVPRPPPDEGEITLAPPAVIAEEGELLVIDKPAGWAAHPTAGRYEQTITTWLQSQGHPHEPAHRLDVETSGLLLCATGESLRALKEAFRQQVVEKFYLAVVEGRPPFEEWEVAAPLGFDTRSAVRLKMGRGDLPARSRFFLRRTGPGRSLIEARPQSGRQHQLRVHLSLAGYPIVGDKLYGPDETFFLKQLESALEEEDWVRLGHHRQALHAWRISFQLGGRPYRFEAPWPAELEALIERDC
ncbi:MAG: RluA family pseudouridine synthase [Myxococcota bacterium]|nr:RluA family pseudouridine synthase [Myxococcota bacterium]